MMWIQVCNWAKIYKDMKGKLLIQKIYTIFFNISNFIKQGLFG